jgi:hypothetical protein
MNRRILGAALAVLLGAGVLGMATSAAADGSDQGPGYPVVEHPAPGVGLIPPAIWERSADGTVTRVQ